MFGFDGEILLHHQRVGGDGVDFNSVDVVFFASWLNQFFCQRVFLPEPRPIACVSFTLRQRGLSLAPEIRFSALLHTGRGAAILTCARHCALTLDVIEGAGLAHILEVAGYL